MISKILKLTCVLALVAGCSTQHVYVADKPMDYEVSRTNHFFLYGVAQTSEVDVNRMCKGDDKVSKVQSRMNAWQSILTLLTFGMYHPLTSTVYCAKS